MSNKGDMHYSPTQIATFKNCPKRYKFRYIDRIRTDEENIEAFMGKRVHECLEKLYRELINSKKNSLKQILSFYEKRWKKKWHKNIRIVNKEFSKDHYFKTGQRCIEDYYKRYHPFDQQRTIGLELSVKIPLNGGDNPYFMTGIIDRLAYCGNGVYEVHDYKTSSTLPDSARLEQDRQLPLYQLAVEEMWRDVKEVRLIWHFLAFDKELSSSRSPEELTLLKKEVRDTINRIETEEVFSPIESPLCGWCEYRSMCPVWKHLYKVDNLPPQEAFSDDGVSLVNQYVTKKRELSELEAEIEMLKDALKTYVKQEKVEVIFGENYKVRAKANNKWTFPSKTEAPSRRKELEEWLKKIRKWKEVSSLNQTALEGVLKKGLWKEKHLNKLKEYGRLEERVSFYISRIRED